MTIPAIYKGLPHLPTAGFTVAAQTRLVPFLIHAWMEASRPSRSDDVVETTDRGFGYLFDIEHQRLIAAWGFSSGRNSEARPESRMKGHPLSAGSDYDRGHAIAHTLGGGTDINLVPQLARINRVDFRVLEKKAVATPGALYFTFWLYPKIAARARWQVQTPTGVDQGLFIAGHPPEIVRLGN